MFCSDPFSLSIYETLQFGFFSANVPVLIYYSHLTALVVSLALSFFVFINNKLLTARILVAISLIWTQIDSRVLMFLWSFWLFLFIAIFILSFYFLYTFINKKDAPFKAKLAAAALLLAVLSVSVSPLNLSGFNLVDCSAVEELGALNTIFILSFIIFLVSIFYGLKKIRLESNKVERHRIMFATAGVGCFLLFFSGAAYIASIANFFEASPDTFLIEQYGYFGMTIFIAFLTYTIVRYRAFNIKLIATQALVTAVIILIGSQFFFIRNPINYALNGITLAGVLGFGYLLVKSVKREVEQRERLEVLTRELAAANDKLKDLDKLKSQFLSFASHDLKSPIALIKQFATLIYDGTYADTAKIKETAFKIKMTADRAVTLVENFLDIRKIEEGKMEYVFEEKNIVEFVKGITSDFELLAKQKGLTVSFQTTSPDIKVKIDTSKMRQVIQNFLDNSLKYIEAGWIKVSLIEEQSTVTVAISDSGIGMDKEILPTLFEQFRRDPSVAKKIQGTGLGLYISKEIVQAHGGEVWAESEGRGKGSTFSIRLKKA